MCYTDLVDTPQQPDDLDRFEPEDPEEAARLDAEAEAQFETGEYIPHERMAEWLRASMQAVKDGKPLPPEPPTEAELARERNQTT